MLTNKTYDIDTEDIV